MMKPWSVSQLLPHPTTGLSMTAFSLATCPQGWYPPRSCSSLFTLTMVIFLE